MLTEAGEELPLDEKVVIWSDDVSDVNPVIESAEYAYKQTNVVQVNEEGISIAARHIYSKLRAESYNPRTWRTQPLHLVPVEPYVASEPLNESVLNWIFLLSALNFSFWSPSEGQIDRYGVEWLAGWNDSEKNPKIWTGYWSLVASLNRALQDNIPITDPHFYSSELLCPDSLITSVFRPATQCSETIPLLQERISVMREVGFILCNSFEGSYKGFLEEFQRRHDGQGTALDLVKMVTNTFPSFRDEVFYNGKRVCFWKRAQILVAETWAAFYPDPSLTEIHPLFPGIRGPVIQDLTMFADYRVPQILHHLRMLEYPPSLVRKLQEKLELEPGSKEEISLRASSIVAVEKLKDAILNLISNEDAGATYEVSSVLIDFFLWDLAKKLERGDEKIDDIETTDIIPAHRTRSIWY
ncbi:hypothetical protein F5878DRAFT_541212 [Lentinula raphanica]|uniref:Queuosine 5'-phosphate N-glycosylase/hydrolase n=1 Tax=Lentinula raphanica TaxID=153919 RepID=A0AA38UBQ9_9AGAR|nr:hypothetical protein F5880DRAFT_1700791 [Lentinula raphanica]KAJ3836534.1 hypothetical protein F5878DRAFT_541212 [Lentinula raphanica]